MGASATAPKSVAKTHGLAYWMAQVLEECNHAAADFSADPVHDLRVALRRCRSIADGLMSIDPDPSWKEMKKAGRQLFRQLGELRDTQVMEEWVHRLATPGDSSASAMLRFLASQESGQKHKAAEALQEFDRKQWTKWATSLPRRAARIRNASVIFKHLALERWTAARRLHGRAVRARSSTPWHNLRIGLKRFRYIVENFLPEHHEAWIDDLKKLQDLLGEIHDLDVLWATALEMEAFPDAPTRDHWHAIIQKEREERIERYRQKMTGENSPWQAWRAELPRGKEIEAAAISRLKFWASVLDPDFRHSVQVTRLALQIYDGMSREGSHSNPGQERSALELAALLHDVGLSKRQKNHHKATRRMIQKLNPPLGLKTETMQLIASISRYHRGALPHRGQKSFDQIPQAERRAAVRLAAVLRLANSFDSDHAHRIDRLRVNAQDATMMIFAHGYHPRSGNAEAIAAGRHLLELVTRKPILIKPMSPGLRRRTGKRSSA
jgi:CHAD domain-containing protein/HD superfamily phosphodiesterase